MPKKITIEKNAPFISIRSDRGGEFINESSVEYYEKKRIQYQLLAPRTPLNDQDLPHKFWTEAINTTCYTCNRCLVKPLLDEISYELYHSNIPSISHFKVFGSKCYILNTKDQLEI